MDKEYYSIETIKSDFGIAENSVDAIRSKLRSMQAAIHPDKNGGVFVSQDDEKRFHTLSEAIEFIDSQEKSGALVSVSAVTDLTKAVTDLVKAQSSTNSIALSEQISHSVESYRSRHKLPKIALSGISIAIAAIWVFPDSVKEHPVLGGWFDFSSLESSIVWLQVLIFAGAFWVLTWINEEKQKRFQEGLNTELVQNRIFSRFIESLEKDTFTLEEFVEYLMRKHAQTHQRPLFLIFGNPREIDMPMAHTIAEIILERGVSRKALLLECTGKMSTEYRLVTAANKVN